MSNNPQDHFCDYCGDKIREEWLNGDYSLLVCDKPECLQMMQEVEDIKFDTQFGYNDGK